MAAAKTATETPSLRDLSAEIQRASIRAKAELHEARARLGELRSQREQLLSAPLHRDDLQSELARHVEKKGSEAIDFLRQTVQEMRDRTGSLATTAPETMATYDPYAKAWLPEVCALLADPEAVAQRILQAVGELDNTVPEGLPLVERRKVVADLDQKIQAAESYESELIQGLQAAGIKLPMPTDPVPEPQPGDEKVIAGDLHRWVSYTGRAGSYGWMPVAEIEQRAA